MRADVTARVARADDVPALTALLAADRDLLVAGQRQDHLLFQLLADGGDEAAAPGVR